MTFHGARTPPMTTSPCDLRPPVRIPTSESGGNAAADASGRTAEGGIEVKVQAADVEDIAFPVVGTSDGPSDLRRRSRNSGSKNTRDPDRVVRMVRSRVRTSHVTEKRLGDTCQLSREAGVDFVGLASWGKMDGIGNQLNGKAFDMPKAKVDKVM